MISLSSLRACAEAKFQLVCHLIAGMTGPLPLRFGMPVTAPGLAVPLVRGMVLVGPSIAGSAAGAGWVKKTSAAIAKRLVAAAAIRRRGGRWFISVGLSACRRSDGKGGARFPLDEFRFMDAPAVIPTDRSCRRIGAAKGGRGRSGIRTHE